MARVKQLRQQKGWSAEQLAAEMAVEGIPWTRDTVVNLENGRRKRLAVHELVALAYVLDVSAPVELLAPGRDGAALPVTPDVHLPVETIRPWLLGETGPLRGRVREVADRAYKDAEEIVWKVARESGMPETAIEALVSQLRVSPGWGHDAHLEDGSDGQD
jgi:transcriptional regulator with XRE-family HTH domain